MLEQNNNINIKKISHFEKPKVSHSAETDLESLRKTILFSKTDLMFHRCMSKENSLDRSLESTDFLIEQIIITKFLSDKKFVSNYTDTALRLQQKVLNDFYAEYWGNSIENFIPEYRRSILKPTYIPTSSILLDFYLNDVYKKKYNQDWQYSLFKNITTLDSIKKMKLFDRDKGYWNIGLSIGGETQYKNAYQTFDQLLGILNTADSSKDDALNEYKKFKQSRFYDRENDLWLADDFSSTPQVSIYNTATELLALIVESKLNVDNPKGKFRYFEQNLIDKETGFWKNYFIEDLKTYYPFKNVFSSKDQLMAIWAKAEIFGNQEISQKENILPLPQKRKF